MAPATGPAWDGTRAAAAATAQASRLSAEKARAQPGRAPASPHGPEAKRVAIAAALERARARRAAYGKR
jgi:hypothetical protein